MELIERYLQAVSFWLPTPAKQDIVAELSEDIYAQVEEREQSAGRSLTEAEVSALLKTRGRPMFVANGYQPKRYLIGPLLFPIYRFVLKVAVACYLLPNLLVSLGLAVSPGWRSTHGFSAIGAIGSAMAHMWGATLFAFVSVTVTFAVLEKMDAVSKIFTTWDPGKLSPVRSPNHLSRSSAIFECALTLGLAIWWLTKMASPMVFNRGGLQIWFTPLWRVFFCGLLIVWLGQACLAFVNALRPYWTPLRSSLRLVFDVASTTLLCYLVQADIVSNVMISTFTPARCIAIKDSINLFAERSLPIVIVGCVLMATIDAFRIVRVSRSNDDSYRVNPGTHGKLTSI